jgi:threonine synthase
VGGGALASALAQGFALTRSNGLISSLPKLIAVQTVGCAPLARAWERLGEIDLATAATTRSRFMWPWETTPTSLAHGILDDETYDWWAIAEGMRASGGSTIVVDEAQVAAAYKAGRAHTDIAASATGTAGLAGVIAKPNAGKQIAVIFSGAER